MKKIYAYFIAGRFIIRVYGWRVKAHPGRFTTYHQTEEALFMRAAKYGYTQVTLD